MHDERLASGDEVGRYQIVEHFATGGMAEVYLATRTGIGGFQKTVILKTVRRSVLEDETFVKMFLDEARIAGSLNHSNIAAVYEAEEIADVAFIIMEFVPGPSAGKLIRQADRANKSNRIAAAHLIACAARGLHHAHSATCGTGERAGLVHRDVSLDNILVSKDGVAKVIDFGIAKVKDRISQTQNDAVKGKIAYMAPEQMESGRDLDHRADIYSLGVCLYRATTGHFPFPQTTTSLLIKARVKNAYTPPSEIVPDYPPALAAIIQRAMEAEPSDRYGSAREMADGIESWVRSQEPEYDDAHIAAWISDVFPDETAWRPRRRAGRTNSEFPATTNSSNGALGGSRRGVTLAPPDTGQHLISGQTATTGQHLTTPITVTTTWGRMLGGTLAAAVIVGFLIVAVLGLTFTYWPSATVDASGTPDARVVVYLDEAEKAGLSGDWSLARRLLEEARALPTKDPLLTVRVSKLANHVERGQSLAGAHEALARGDHEDATRHARAVLDNDPTDAEATAILMEIHRSEAPEAGPTERVFIESDPAGATVFIDDVPVGETPLTYDVALGKHEIWLRKSGFDAKTQAIEVAVGAPVAVSVALGTARVATAASPTKPTRPAVTPVITAPTPSALPTPAVEPAAVAAVTPPVTAPPLPVVTPPPAVTQPVTAPPPAVAAAPVFNASKRDLLPARVRARSIDEVATTLAAIEATLIAAGMPASTAKGSTSLLAEDLLGLASPGTILDVYPQGVFDAIADAWKLNLPAAKLKSAARRGNRP